MEMTKKSRCRVSGLKPEKSGMMRYAQSANASCNNRSHGRREFLNWTLTALGGTMLSRDEVLARDLDDSSSSVSIVQRPAALSQTHSDVGSLFPFIQNQARKKDLPLSFLQPQFTTVQQWKRRARAKFFELLHYAPPKCDYQPEVVERVDTGDYVREKVYFNTTPDLRIPAFVLIPKKAKKPAPGIVALHDHGGFYFWGKEKLVEMPEEHPELRDFKAEAYAGRSIASELARQGYVVIVTDMFYWGERRMILDDDPADWRQRPTTITRERIREFNERAGQNEQLVGRTIYAAGFTWSGVMFWDDIRTLDYLLTRPEVDKNRVGCVGLSVGAIRSCHLAALDDRIKVAVIIGWMTSFPWQLQQHIKNTIGFTKLVPGLYQYLDYPDVASMALPTPLLLINGKKDTLFDPAGVQASFDKLNACYRKAKVPERCHARWYDTPHEFNVEMQAEAWEWLRKWV
jgi:dienelactone hydrolase